MKAAPPSQLSIRIARNLQEIEQIRGIWTSWQSHPTSDIDNFFLVLNSRPKVERPHVMIVRRDGQPETILVGRMETVRLHFKVGYFPLFRPTARVLCFMHGGLLGSQSAENAQFLVQEIGKCLRNGEADLARFDFPRTDSPISIAAATSPSFFCRDHFSTTTLHGRVCLPDTYEDFLQSLSRKERHNFNRCANKIQNDFPGQMNIRCYRNANEIEELVRAAEEVARKTYQRGLSVGFRDDEETRGWLHMAAEKGMLRACVLFLKDKPCAFMIGKQYQHTLHGDYMGFDPEYNAYAPGSQLLLHWIQDAFRATGPHKVTEIDLGAGDARYKRMIFTDTWQESLAYVFAPSCKGLVLNFQSTTSHLVARSVKQLAKSCASVEKIKKVWRTSLHVSQRQPTT
jgi:CelD/BcsL family acetyltransferase involved in cellulose biosynthesis